MSWLFNLFRGSSPGPRSSEKLDNQITQTKIDLLMAKGTPLSRRLDEERKKMYIREQEQEHKRMMQPLLDMQRRTADKVIQHLYQTGDISHDEYAKYMLDETGTYHPKLKEV